MKKMITILLMLAALNTKAQDKPEKIDQYCELLATGKFLSYKVTINIDYGEEARVFEFKDKKIKDQLNKVKSFTSVVAAMNYMGSIGWKFIDSYPITEGAGAAEKGLHFFFRRTFDRAELEEVALKEPSVK